MEIYVIRTLTLYGLDPICKNTYRDSGEIVWRGLDAATIALATRTWTGDTNGAVAVSDLLNWAGQRELAEMYKTVESNRDDARAAADALSEPSGVLMTAQPKPGVPETLWSDVADRASAAADELSRIETKVRALFADARARYRAVCPADGV